jgi:hypothetical protein
LHTQPEYTAPNGYSHGQFPPLHSAADFPAETPHPGIFSTSGQAFGCRAEDLA